MRYLRATTPAKQRDFEIYYAGVLRREAGARTGPFAASLLEWAENAERRAVAIDLSPEQPDLFGSFSA